jgi:hypothetical protein
VDLRGRERGGIREGREREERERV